MPTGPNPLSYRPVTSRVGSVAYVVFAGWWVVATGLAGEWDEAAAVAPLLAGVGACVYGVFWRPAVLVDDHGVELRNVLRDVKVSWPALEGLETRYALTLVVGERRFRSWAAAAPGRPSPLAPVPTAPGTRRGPGETVDARDAPPAAGGGSPPEAIRSSRSLRADSGATAFMVETRWEQRRRLPWDGPSLETRWVRVWPALALASFALAGLAVLLPL